MPLHPYEHEHVAVEEVSWSRLSRLLIELAETVRRDANPEIVVGIAKGGVVPAVFLSSAFGLDFYPVKLSSRRKEQIVSVLPIWYVFPSEHVRGKSVLVVDDICVAGRTLARATQQLRDRGATEVKSATVAAHPGGARPDYTVLQTEALVVWPWDRDVLSPEGRWSINPEYLEQMGEVAGYTPGPSPAR